MWHVERGGHLQSILGRGHYLRGEAEAEGRRRWPEGGWTVVFRPN